MRSSRLFAVTLAAAAILSGCRRTGGEVSEAEAAELASREKRLASRIAAAAGDSTGATPLARWVLPPELREISGLALTADGNLLAHNDEHGTVFVIDPKRGVVLRRFFIGTLRGDFEGIAVQGADIYMLVSNGIIYRFREGKDSQRVQYALLDPKLGRECEFESIAVESAGTVVLACKNVGKNGPRDQLVFYRWDPRQRASPPTMFTIPFTDAIAGNGWKKLSPSDMTIDPTTGNYIVIAAQEKALLEISAGGEMVRSRRMPGSPQQAEGIAISREGILMIADEGVNGVASITLYSWPLGSRSMSGSGSADTSMGAR